MDEALGTRTRRVRVQLLVPLLVFDASLLALGKHLCEMVEILLRQRFHAIALRAVVRGAT
jgi:hypothetical protein